MAVADELGGAGLLDAGMRATRWGGLLFVPAALWTPDGWSDGVPPEPLVRYSTAYLPTGVQPDGGNLLEYSNALWVRARLPVALGFAPPTCRQSLRRHFLNAGMLAGNVQGEVPTIIPFICADDWLGAELRFGQTSDANRFQRSPTIRSLDRSQLQEPHGLFDTVNGLPVPEPATECEYLEV